MAEPSQAAALRIEVVYSPAPRQVWHWAGELPPGTTLAQALAASGLPQAFPALELGEAVVGLWGRRHAPGDALRDGDRVEVYRALTVDPKEARRQRYRQHRERRAAAGSVTCSPKR